MSEVPQHATVDQQMAGAHAAPAYLQDTWLLAEHPDPDRKEAHHQERSVEAIGIDLCWTELRGAPHKS